MDKYTIAPPAGSTQNSVGAADRPWKEGHFDSVKLKGGDLGEYLAESTGYGIVSGCEPSISGLTVTVSAGVVHLADGTRKEISTSNITLDAADGTNPRIDLVYITSTGAVAKVTGTASASPVVPTLPSGGISVCNVTIVAGATTGAITDKRDMLPRYYNTGIVNVKDFGAVGDGVHDDTTAIQAAIDANHNKIIFFPAGVYVITQTLRAFSSIRGSGCARGWVAETLLKDSSVAIIDGSQVSDRCVLDISNAVHNFDMSDINIIGSSNANVTCVYMSKPSGLFGLSMTFNNINIVDIKKYGIYLDSAVASTRAVYMNNISVNSREIEDSVGIYLGANLIDSRIDNLEIMGCNVGIEVNTAIYGSNWHIWVGGAANPTYWDKSACIKKTDTSFMILNTIYCDSARYAIDCAVNARITVDNLIVYSEGNITSSNNGCLFSRNCFANVSNAQLYLSDHFSAPFSARNVGMDYQNLLVQIRMSNNEFLSLPSASLPTSLVKDVHYVVAGKTVEANKYMLIGYAVKSGGGGHAKIHVEDLGGLDVDVIVGKQRTTWACKLVTRINSMGATFYHGEFDTTDKAPIYIKVPADRQLFMGVASERYNGYDYFGEGMGLLDLGVITGNGWIWEDFPVITDGTGLTEITS